MGAAPSAVADAIAHTTIWLVFVISMPTLAISAIGSVAALGHVVVSPDSIETISRLQMEVPLFSEIRSTQHIGRGEP